LGTGEKQNKKGKQKEQKKKKKQKEQKKIGNRRLPLSHY